jgi:hypothetical protein
MRLPETSVDCARLAFEEAIKDAAYQREATDMSNRRRKPDRRWLPAGSRNGV